MCAFLYKYLLGVIGAALFFFGGINFALAMDYYAAGGMVVSLDTGSLPMESSQLFKKRIKNQTPEFFLEDSDKKLYPMEVVTSAPDSFKLRVAQDVPVGFHRIYAKFRGSKPLVVNYGLQINPPVLSQVQINQLATGPELHMQGLFFGQNPQVSLIYRDAQTGAESTQEGVVLPSSLSFEDPYQEGTQSLPMAVDTGESNLEVQMPQLPTEVPFQVVTLRVKNDSGYTDHYLTVSNAGLEAPTVKRGQLISVSPKDQWGYSQVKNNILDAMVGPSSSWKFVKKAAVDLLFGENESPKTWEMLQEVRYGNTGYNVHLYNIRYWTQLMNGTFTQASGVVVMPIRPPRDAPPANPAVVMFLHGTMLKKTEAPSITTGPELGLSTLFAAGYGQIVAVPDHLGLGEASLDPSVLHPYCQWEPNARVDGDMIPAIRQLLANPKFEESVPNWNKKLFLTGFSEGGYLTLGLHIELERNPEQYGFVAGSSPVTASTPLEGPYSLSVTMVDKLLDPKPFPSPYFAPYLLSTLNASYNFSPDSSYLNNVSPEYYRLVLPPLINGLYSDTQVNLSMPSVIGETMSDAAKQDLRDKDASKSKLYSALTDNDLVKLDYTIASPIMLIHGEGDDLVPYDNAVREEPKLTARGRQDVLTKMRGPSTVQEGLKVAGISYHASYIVKSIGLSWDWLKKH